LNLEKQKYFLNVGNKPMKCLARASGGYFKDWLFIRKINTFPLILLYSFDAGAMKRLNGPYRFVQVQRHCSSSWEHVCSLGEEKDSASLLPRLNSGVCRCSAIALRLGGVGLFFERPPPRFVARNETF
jgi:hypothetical protein